MIYFNCEVSKWSTSNLLQVIKTSSLPGCFVVFFGVLFSIISKKATGLTSAQDEDAYTGRDVLEDLSSWEFFFLFIHSCLSPWQPHQPSLLPSPMEEWELNSVTVRKEGEDPGLTLCGFFFPSGICWLPHPAASVWRRVWFEHGRYQQAFSQDWCL